MKTETKILNRISPNQNAAIYKNNTPWPTEVYSRNARLVQFVKKNQCESLIEKAQMILSVDWEKAFDTTKHPFMRKNSQPSRNRRNLPLCNKRHLKNKKQKQKKKKPKFWLLLPMKSLTRPRCLLSPLLFNKYHKS